jgi:hypothetical protein
MHKRILLVTAFAFGMAAPALAGGWSTTYGDMSLPDQPQSGALRAPYTDDNGRIVGEMRIPKCIGCGPVVTGIWVENASGQRCDTARDGSNYWGGVEFEFNGDYTSFTGHWNYCGSGGGSPWKGRIGGSRLPQAPSK